MVVLWQYIGKQIISLKVWLKDKNIAKHFITELKKHTTY